MNANEAAQKTLEKDIVRAFQHKWIPYVINEGSHLVGVDAAKDQTSWPLGFNVCFLFSESKAIRLTCFLSIVPNEQSHSSSCGIETIAALTLKKYVWMGKNLWKKIT